MKTGTWVVKRQISASMEERFQLRILKFRGLLASQVASV